MSSTWWRNNSETCRRCSAASAIGSNHFRFSTAEEMPSRTRTVAILERRRVLRWRRGTPRDSQIKTRTYGCTPVAFDDKQADVMVDSCGPANDMRRLARAVPGAGAAYQGCISSQRTPARSRSVCGLFGAASDASAAGFAHRDSARGARANRLRGVGVLIEDAAGAPLDQGCGMDRAGLQRGNPRAELIATYVRCRLRCLSTSNIVALADPPKTDCSFVSATISRLFFGF